eukprot:1175741-Prorocentrum_lima.AAC.1
MASGATAVVAGSAMGLACGVVQMAAATSSEGGSTSGPCTTISGLCPVHVSRDLPPPDGPK